MIYFFINKYKFLIGIFFGIIIISLLANNSKNIQLDKFALGDNNISGSGKVDGERVHCYYFTDTKECLNNFKNQSIKNVIIWLGNSQLDAINQFKQGDETASINLHKKLREQNKYLITISQPNANLQEHYLLFSNLLNELKIELLILPLVFDDMREDGIRPELKDAFKNKFTLNNLNHSKIGKKIINDYADEIINKNDNNNSIYQPKNNLNENSREDLSFLDTNLQKRVEKFLDNKLKSLWSIWKKRDDIRGYLFTKLYQIRNWVFNIKASTTRKLIPAYYNKNIESYKAILSLANKNKIRILPYIVPLRNDVKIPYDINEYSKFKNDILLISKKNNIDLFNLENLIPGEYWGTKNSTNISSKEELDFMHFRKEGHMLLAEKIYSLLFNDIE